MDNNIVYGGNIVWTVTNRTNNLGEVGMPDVNGVEMIALGISGMCFLGFIWMWGYRCAAKQYEKVIREINEIIESPMNKEVKVEAVGSIITDVFTREEE